MIHELKTWPQFFGEMANGKKTFELRKDDRPYKPDDTLLLREFDPVTSEFTGRQLQVVVANVHRCLPEFGLAPGHVILSVRKVIHPWGTET